MEALLADLKPYLDYKLLTAFVIDFGLKILVAALVFFVGRWLAVKLSNLVARALKRTHVDATLVSFLSNIAYVALLTLVVVVSINQLGIQTTSIAAVIAAAGLAVGLALQGSLSNFAAGVLIILFRPFRVGDKIETADHVGYVEDINIFTTSIRAADNRVFIVPNARVTGDCIVNYTIKSQRRIDLEIPLSYDMNIVAARKAIQNAIDSIEDIYKDPAPLIAVKSLQIWGVIMAVEVWVDTPKHADTMNALFEAIWNGLHKNADAFPRVPPQPSATELAVA